MYMSEKVSCATPLRGLRYSGSHREETTSMKKPLIIINVIISVIVVRTTTAQIHLNTVSANIGSIRTLFPDYSFYHDFQYSIYPEFQIGGDFLTPSIRWVTYWGFWADGIENALPVADFVTYSYSSHIVGARFNFLLENFLPHVPLPIGIFTGVAHHFISVRYVGGFGFDGKAGHDYSDGVTTFEIGVNGEVDVFDQIAIRAEVQQFVPLGSKEFDRAQKNRRAYKVGLAFTF
jgi:hypothetical protein